MKLPTLATEPWLNRIGKNEPHKCTLSEYRARRNLLIAQGHSEQEAHALTLEHYANLKPTNTRCIIEDYQQEISNRQQQIHLELKGLHPQPYKKVFIRVIMLNRESQALRVKYMDMQEYLLRN